MAPMVIGHRLGSKSRSICAILWKGIMIAEDKNIHKGFGWSPLRKSSTNFLRRLAVEVWLAASLNSSHVHSSLIGADFFGMPAKAYETAFIGMGTKSDLKAYRGDGTCVCGDDLVSLVKKVATTAGSDSVP